MNNSKTTPLYIIIALLLIFIAYMVGQNSNKNSINNSYKHTASTNTEQNNSKLSPDEWVSKYISTLAECRNLVKADPPAVMLGPNDDFALYNFKIESERDAKAQELLKKDYPELYEYKNIPEYSEKLSQYYNEQNQQSMTQFQNQLKIQEWNNTLNQQRF